MRRKIIVIVVLLFIGIIGWIAISELLLKGVLQVSSSGSGTKLAITVTGSDGVVIKQATVQVGDTVSVRTKPGTYSVDAKTDEGESLASGIVARASTTTVNVSLAPERKVEKIGYDSLGCDIWQQPLLYTYGCARETLILAHTPARQTFTEDTAISGGYYQVGSVVSYNGGLLAQLKMNESVQPAYIRGGAITEITRPTDDQTIYTILTDPSTESGTFVLADVLSKSAYVYSSPEDKQPRKIVLPVSDDERESNAFSLVNDTLHMLTGQTDLTGDFSSKTELSDDITAYSFNLSSGTQTSKEVIGSSKMNYATTIRDQAYVTQNSQTLTVYAADSKQAIFSALSTDSFTTINDSLYFVKDNSVFEYNTKSGQAQRLFHSGHLRISVVAPSKSGVTFNAMIDGSTASTLHSYVVTQYNQTGKRLEDVLPYDPTFIILPMIKMDYSSDSITVQLALNSFTSDRETGNVSYDTAEFNTKKQVILNQLHNDGVTIPDSNIFFVP